ncbi:SRPBCC family protein [Pedobacter sp. HDW13]|uniref:SRPBCC family protein n=1 Tax=unclassified Pedobacter TaxID=2628915 RepID=UPI000F590383|nr:MULTISPECIES: SRPBCC family protein [unclassified Pedobacter]QIL39241.1 SRPBCC family protein [Pedobacter sp. HDW13]RQO65668.1 cell division protein [Pedobacter sp. KBW01]
MPTILLKTRIYAPIEKCFDLSRDLDLHMESMKDSKEKIIAGRSNGLIGLGEEVTWQARHFGLSFNMTNKITAMKPPFYFVDEMLSGPFKTLHHQHHFTLADAYTEMTDIFAFQSPMGTLGRLVDLLFLKRYMHKLLIARNQVIKSVAERP